MSDNFDKPFMTYDELINLMKLRGIEVADYDFALSALQNHSYYTIVNGYKHIFNFYDNNIKTRFEDIYTLYTLDSSINNIIFKYILLVERGLKSRLSYQVAKNYGVYTSWKDLDYEHPDLSDTNDYLCMRFYSNSNNTRFNTLKLLKKTFVEKWQSAPLKHYKKTKNHIPPWILCTSITFGKALMWYGILRNNDKAAICASYFKPYDLSIDSQKDLLKKSLSLLREYRNLIAHGSRIFPDNSLPHLPKDVILSLFTDVLTPIEYNRKIGQCDTLAIILALFLLLVDKYSTQNFLSELYSTLLPYKDFAINDKYAFELLNLPVDILLKLSSLSLS